MRTSEESKPFAPAGDCSPARLGAGLRPLVERSRRQTVARSSFGLLRR